MKWVAMRMATISAFLKRVFLAAVSGLTPDRVGTKLHGYSVILTSQVVEFGTRSHVWETMVGFTAPLLFK